MIRRLLAFCASFMLFAAKAQGQAYEPGYLVRSNGDTLRGDIENSFWIEPPALIRFRTAGATESETFRPRQLRSVAFATGRHFRFEVLRIDHAAVTALVDLPRGHTSNIRIDSVLADVLVEGPCTLVRVDIRSALHYVLQQAGRPSLDLSERKYLRQNSEGVWVVADGNDYRNQLALYFAECPAALSAIATVGFTSEALSDMVLAYNRQCAGGTAITHSWLPQAVPRRKVAILVGAVVGLRYYSTPSGDDFQPTVDRQLRPFAGLYAELLRPGRNFSFFAEATFNTVSGRLTNYFIEGTNDFTKKAYSAYNYENFNGIQGCFRVSARHYFGLPRDQRLLLGLFVEINPLLSETITSSSSATKGILPDDMPAYSGLNTSGFIGAGLGLSIGWRYQRFTLAADGLLLPLMVDSELRGLRGSLAYRLDGNPDQLRP